MSNFSGVYKVFPRDTIYFVTTTVVDWVDVFTRDEYKQIIVDALNHCRRNKGLKIYAWVLMTNHVHLIVSHEVDNRHLASAIGDFKKHTSKMVVRSIIDNPKESRRKWLLEHFDESNIIMSNDASCSVSKTRNGSTSHHYHLWQRGYDAYCIYNIAHLKQKIDYLHANPVRAGIVDEPWEYRHSSMRNYCGQQGLVDIDLLDIW